LAPKSPLFFGNDYISKRRHSKKTFRGKNKEKHKKMSWVGRVFKSSPSSGDGGKRSNRKKKRLAGKKNDSSSTADPASATSGGIKSFLSSLMPGGSSKKNSKKKYNRVSEESHELRAINHNNS